MLRAIRDQEVSFSLRTDDDDQRAPRHYQLRGVTDRKPRDDKAGRSQGRELLGELGSAQ